MIFVYEKEGLLLCNSPFFGSQWCFLTVAAAAEQKDGCQNEQSGGVIVQKTAKAVLIHRDALLIVFERPRGLRLSPLNTIL